MSQSRIRVTVDVSEAHKRAFYARANFEGKSPQKLFEEWVEQCAPEEFERAREMVQADEGGEGEEPNQGGADKPKKGGKKK